MRLYASQSMTQSSRNSLPNFYFQQICTTFSVNRPKKSKEKSPVFSKRYKHISLSAFFFAKISHFQKAPKNAVVLLQKNYEPSIYKIRQFNFFKKKKKILLYANQNIVIQVKGKTIQEKKLKIELKNLPIKLYDFYIFLV